jgi:SAM-dependent methyltransferase
MGFWNSVYSLLAVPAVYRLFGDVVVGGGYRVYMAEYVKPVAGEKVLDIGCGAGDILEYLPEMDYLGFDVNPQYIDAAKKRFGPRGRFFNWDVRLTAIEEEEGTFDLVLATGVVHHLDDERAFRLFQLAHKFLKPGGRLITYDGCYVDGQTRLSRWVVSRDRGRFVRPREAYLKLAGKLFQHVEPAVRHDLLRIPYTHLILRCIK